MLQHRKLRIVLDAECGWRKYEVKLFGERTYFVITCDIDECVRPDAVCDIHCLPFREKLFDLVLLVEVLEHLENPAKALAKIQRCLRDGGLLI